MLFNYVVTWVSLCVLALVVAMKELRLDWRDEWRRISAPWQLALFIPAIVFVTFAGSFTNDETWDVVTGAGMSLLTFFTAGWSVRTLFSRDASWSHRFIALIVALFASSWFYDGWMLLRDGAYTVRWFGNLLLSPIIYVCAGLVMNLERRWRLAAGVPLVAVASYVLVAFVRWEW